MGWRQRSVQKEGAALVHHGLIENTFIVRAVAVMDGWE